MDTLQALRALRPGTSWTLMADGTIIQVQDGTPRVIIPTNAEIQAYIAANPDPPPPPPLQDQIKALQTQLNNLIAQLQAAKVI